MSAKSSPPVLDISKQLRGATEDEALSLVKGYLQKEGSAQPSELLWKSAEAGRFLAFEHLLALVPDKNDYLHFMFAASGGNPDIVRYCVQATAADASLEHPKWEDLVRSIMTGHGHQGIHPRADEALAVMLSDDRSRTLDVSFAMWQQIGIYPRVQFLPLLEAAYHDLDRPNHPVLVINAWCMALMGCARHEPPLPELGTHPEEVALALDRLTTTLGKMRAFRSDMFTLRQIKQEGFVESMMDRLGASSSLPIERWRKMLFRSLGPAYFPKEHAQNREAKLAVQSSSERRSRPRG